MIDTEVYIEQGCDIAAFEKDVNKALAKLCKTREVVSVEYKTGFDHEKSGELCNWYSVAIEHRRKVSFAYDKQTKQMDALNKRFDDYCTASSKLIKKVNEHETNLVRLLDVDDKRKRDIKIANAKKEREKESKRRIVISKGPESKKKVSLKKKSPQKTFSALINKRSSKKKPLKKAKGK